MIPEALKQLLISELNTRINTNNVRAITGAIMNDFLNDFIAAIQGSVISDNTAPNTDINRVFWRDTETNDLRYYNQDVANWASVTTRYRLSDFGVLGNGTDETIKVQHALDFITDYNYSELICDVPEVICKNVILKSNVNFLGTDCTFISPDASPVFVSYEQINKVTFSGISFKDSLGVFVQGSAESLAFYNVSFQNALYGLKISPTEGNFVKGVYISKTKFISSGCEFTGAVTGVSVYENSVFTPYASGYALEIKTSNTGFPSMFQFIGVDFNGYAQSTVGQAKGVKISGSSEIVFFSCSFTNFNKITDINEAELVSFKYCKLQSNSGEYAIGVNICKGFNFEGNKISGNVTEALVKQTSINISDVKYLYQKNNIFEGTNISKVFDFIHTFTPEDNNIKYFREFLLLTSEEEITVNTITDPEGGNRFVTGNKVTLQNPSGENTVTIEHGTGNIYLPGGDVTLSGLDSILTLEYNGTVWVATSGISDNNPEGGTQTGNPFNGLKSYENGTKTGLGGQLEFDTIINALTHELALENGTFRIGSETVNGKLTVYGDIEIIGLENGIIYTDTDGQKYRVRFVNRHYINEPV